MRRTRSGGIIAAWMKMIPLLGGGALLLRPLTPADSDALAAGSAELSPQSAYFRFHAPRSGRLTGAEVAYLTAVDQWDRAAWTLLEGNKGVAVGRYFRLQASPYTAEVALTVLDAWQHRGLAKLLLAALMQTGRRAGIERLGGSVLGQNIAALRLLESLGAAPRRMAGDVWWAEVGTDPAELPRTAAAEALRYYHRLLARDGLD